MTSRMVRIGRLAGIAKFVSGVAALLAVTALFVTDVHARAGTGGSTGSRGSKTYQAPPSTNTAPKATAPVEKSITQPGKATAPTQTAGSATAAQASRFGGFGGIMKGMLLGGLFAAGLAAVFGTGAMASVLGFLLQSLVIGGICFLIFNFIRSRMSGKPALATATANNASVQPEQANYRAAASPMGGGVPALNIAPVDFEAFERLLGEVQTAYGRGDLKALETRTSPEMLSYFASELDQNAKQGVRNELSGVKLLQGDLSEAWREGTIEYATVAMRYAIVDATVEQKSGRVVSGDRSAPQQVTEVWTFLRPANGNAQQWELSAIQQAA